MKKLFKSVAMLGIAVSMAFTATAQNFSKGDNIIGGTIGFGGYYSGSGLLYNDIKRVPSLTLYYENCVKDNLFNEKSSIGVGGVLGYTSAKVADSWKSSHTIIGARGAFHYAVVEKFDAYAGVMLGYDIYSWKWIGSYKGDKIAGGGFDFSAFIGARFYFTDAFAAFAELSYGVAPINLGLSFKF
jgi:hypothetical protein